MATSVRSAFCSVAAVERAVSDHAVVADRLVDDQPEPVARLQLVVEIHFAGEHVGQRHREIGVSPAFAIAANNDDVSASIAPCTVAVVVVTS